MHKSSVFSVSALTILLLMVRPLCAAGDPHECLRTFTNAAASGDESAMKETLATDGPDQEELADAFVHRILAQRNLIVVIERRLRVSSDRLPPSLLPFTDEACRSLMAELDKAEVRIVGNTATLAYGPAGRKSETTTLVAAQGGWRLSLLDTFHLAHGAAPERIRALAATERKYETLANQAAAEINAGRLTTLTDVSRYFEPKMREIVWSDVPSTQPATQPGASQMDVPGSVPHAPASNAGLQQKSNHQR